VSLTDAGLPFEVRTPNEETRRAIEQLEAPEKGAKLKRYGASDEMFDGVLGGKENRSKRRV